MPDKRIRTVVATLVEPTAHKERKLRRLQSTYREALQEAVEAGATTMTAVNDIVTPYDLPYQAKDALKRYVPQLLEDGTPDLDAAQPIRFTNRAATFDHSAERTHEICWAVPQPGRGTDIWIPLAINPAQRDWWEQLLAGDTPPGQLQLVNRPRHDRWELHLPLTLPTPDTGVDHGSCTPVGFDVGEAILLTGCALVDGRPLDPLLVDGGRSRHLNQTLKTTLQRLQERDAAEWRVDERAAYFRHALRDEIETATRKAVEYAAGFDQPVIVLEQLTSIQGALDFGPHMNRRLHAWAFDQLQTRLADKATDAGIPVRYVDPAYTSQICHACGHIGSRPEQAEFRCTNDDCWVSVYQADINAAANIAGRLDPWGESCPWNPDSDDTLRNGRTRDSATGPREQSQSQ
ncbi:transposase [Halobacterium salinarum]|uniref:transposase n=1 Tax=Halobacterium salinarum TaxID=2242 RepID=UPI0025544314|nr:transposase [Halobacterium salinarum]MDL0126394.1 transposase [Halobacterium salinarum]